jgi:hypothetical protein
MANRSRRVSSFARVVTVLVGASLVCLGVSAPAFANSKGREFVGYLVHKTGKLHSASATFDVPTTTCDSNNQIAFGPSLFLQRQSLSAATVDGYGAYELVQCEAAGVAGSLYIELRINGTDRKDLTAMPNDVVHVTVRKSGNTITVIATDKTSKMTAKASGKAKGQSYAVFGDYLTETVSWAKPRNTVTTFSDATVNGAKLGSAHPVAYSCVKGKTIQYKPSAITGGESFTITFVHH